MLQNFFFFLRGLSVSFQRRSLLTHFNIQKDINHLLLPTSAYHSDIHVKKQGDLCQGIFSAYKYHQV